MGSPESAVIVIDNPTEPRLEDWIKTGKQYKDVPQCVLDELARRFALLPSDCALM